ncbi:MAG: GNAT family N-acetyltransferase [Candidatus Melainabacteria bacterium]|nr:GNAT family N-acetyltransferase [Candidatus Melainabacteria bacterium]
MNIQTAEWSDVLKVLHQTFQIWSAGLKPDEYYSYTSFQLNHPWSKKNLRYMVYRHGSTIVSSCKLYNLELASRGQVYSIAGLGAVFTGQEYRGLGYATRMLSQIIELCHKQDVKGLLLFSDIGPGFYNKLGFHEVGAREFAVYLSEANNTKSNIAALQQSLSSDCHDIRLAGCETKQIVWLNKLYARWLRRQTYGFLRSDEHWHYKLAKELYLHTKSQWQWPRLELAILESSPQETGYAIFEYSTKTLRVLEVIVPISVQ